MRSSPKCGISGDKLKSLVELLGKLEELVKVVQRRGIDFADFLAAAIAGMQVGICRCTASWSKGGTESFFTTVAQRATSSCRKTCWAIGRRAADNEGADRNRQRSREGATAAEDSGTA